MAMLPAHRGRVRPSYQEVPAFVSHVRLPGLRRFGNHVESPPLGAIEAGQAEGPLILSAGVPPFSEIDGTSATVRELEHMPRSACRRVTRCWLPPGSRPRGSASTGK
jgi:hypothetical protein